MPASIRSLFASSTARALALTLVACSAVACTDPESNGGGYDGSGPPPGEDGDPNDPGNGGGGGDEEASKPYLGCPQMKTLVPACNYLTTREKNLAAGFTPVTADEDIKTSGRTIFELYQPTEECKGLLEEYFHFDAAWKKPENARARNAALAGLHTLFFHPMMMPADKTMIWKGSPHVFGEGPMASYGVTKAPAEGEYVLRYDHVNTGLLQQFRGEVTKIVFNDYIAPDGQYGEVKMEEWGGQIDVNASWLTVPPYKLNDDLDFVRFKYDVASTFFHEFRHAAGFAQHTSCSTPFGSEGQCDDGISHTSYGEQAQIFNALVLGAAYSRAPNDYDPLASKGHILRNHRVNCERATEKVNDIGKWVKTNDPTRAACGGEDVSLILRSRTPAPAGASLPPSEDGGGEWECI